MFRKLMLLLATSAGFALNAYAQAETDTTDEREIRDTTVKKIEKITDLQPIEVRSIRASSNSPFAKSDITALDIKKQNQGQDLPLLLQYLPSVVINTDAGAGIGYTGIHIRGTDGTRINVTFNGMPVNDPEEQATFFVDIPDIASSTNSIQVQRGVGTSTNGAGAFGGTISISNLKQMDSAGGIFSSSAGSFNTFKNTLLAGTGMLKGGWQFDVRLSKITSDGYIQRSASDLKSLQFTAGYTPNERTSFHFLFMPGTEKTGQAWNGVPQDSLNTNRKYNELGMRSDGTFYNNQTDNYLQNYYQLFADHAVKQSLTAHVGTFLTRGKGYYEEYKAAAAYSDYGLPGSISPGGDTTFQTDLIRRLWLDNYYYGGVFSLQYAGRRTNVALGGGWSQFTNLGYGNIIWTQNGGVADNYKWYQYDAQKNDANVYLKAEHTAGSFTLFGDLQYRNVAYFMNGFRQNPDVRRNVNYDFLNPKAGVNYKITSTDRVTERAYASVAIANREPGRSAFETGIRQLPKYETLTDAELGYELAKRNWNLGVNLYYMYYNNQLVLTGQINDVGAYTQTNVGNSYRAGIELMAAARIVKWCTISGNATLSQNKIDHFTEYVDNYDSAGQRAIAHNNNDIAFSPNVIASAVLAMNVLHSRKGNELGIDLSTKYVGKHYLDNTQSEDRALKAYNYTNVLLRYRIKTRPFKDVTATLALNNLFGALYSNNGYTYGYLSGGNRTTVNYYFPQAGFNVLGGISVRW